MADEHPVPTTSSFPESGKASTYADYFEGKGTSSGDIYRHSGYTAALLPKSRWRALAMGTPLRLTFGSRRVVVKVNDRGKGKLINGTPDESRVLDLSRAAMAFLIGKQTNEINDLSASIITLDKIEVMPVGTPTGPDEGISSGGSK